MEQLKKDLLKLNEADRYRYIVMKFSGNKCKKFRQEFITHLTGEKRPVAKCGVHEIVEILKRGEK